MSELSDWRTLLGRSTVLWAGQDGVEVHEGRWSALSGVGSVDYNVALCHTASGGRDIELSIAEIGDARVPAIIVVAGEALADAQVFVREGWICIGATPFMARALDGGEHDDAVRKLLPEELSAARGLLEETFDLTPQLSTVALPDSCTELAGQAVWGLFEDGELASCAAFVRVEHAVIGWSVATRPALRRRGLGARLLQGALAASHQEGATLALVYASALGQPLYRSLGFRELEQWQMWSRPRWVLARA
jgi:GNAT superfamily N-acetyltransferase